MVKIFVTGDNHFGKKYDRYPEVKDRLIQGRFDAFKNMLDKAEKEQCHLFVIAGDLFDNINSIKVSDVKQIVGMLENFSGNVIVLPGNHDYYTGDEKVWKDFENELATRDHNITLIKEFKPYEYECGEERVIIYPAFCQSKHSKSNNLDWIRSQDIQTENVINIGVAHGAIYGVTPDMKEEYFLMTEAELTAIPVDAWLIGHTHIPYPDYLQEDSDVEGVKIFNAGTHEQTDLHNNTQGNGFIIGVDKNASMAKVYARKYISGVIHYYDLSIDVKPNSETSLADSISAALDGKELNAIVRAKIFGSIKASEYNNKELIYKDILGKYLSYEIEDSELSEEITVEKIRSEYAQTSFAAMFMERLTDNSTELQMAYQLLQKCKED